MGKTLPEGWCSGAALVPEWIGNFPSPLRCEQHGHVWAQQVRVPPHLCHLTSHSRAPALQEGCFQGAFLTLWGLGMLRLSPAEGRLLSLLLNALCSKQADGLSFSLQVMFSSVLLQTPLHPHVSQSGCLSPGSRCWAQKHSSHFVAG